jgi:hypothetical protein
MRGEHLRADGDDLGFHDGSFQSSTDSEQFTVRSFRFLIAGMHFRRAVPLFLIEAVAAVDAVDAGFEVPGGDSQKAVDGSKF